MTASPIWRGWNFPPPNAASLLAQLNGFFGIVEQMSAVDTSGVEPLYTPLSADAGGELRLRDDAVTETDQRDAQPAQRPGGGGRPVPRAQVIR